MDREVGTDQEKFIKGCNLKKERREEREVGWGIVYASCTSMLVAMETVLYETSPHLAFGGGGVM